MATGAVVSIQGVTKTFGGGEAVFEGFSLKVPARQICAIVGPSGAGKSTLLRMLSGSDTDFTGQITIDGTPAKAAPGVGVVFQDPRLLPWETATGNLTVINPALSTQDAQALLQEFGLAGFEDAYPHELSGGMKRRVALARCLSLNPTLMLLDEPFVSLDAALVEELNELLMLTIEHCQATVLLVTHDPRDVDRMADRLVRVDGRPLRIIEDTMLPTQTTKGARR